MGAQWERNCLALRAFGVIFFAVCNAESNAVITRCQCGFTARNKSPLKMGADDLVLCSPDHALMMTRPPHRPSGVLAERQHSCGFPR